MDVDTYQLKVVFLTPILGSQPASNVASEYIAKRNGFELPEDEVETLPDALERGTTVFHRNGGDQPVLFDYMVKGFIKNAGKVLNGKIDGRGGKPVRNLRAKVTDLVFVTPRMIPLQLENGAEIEFLERPLRAETAQGPRVALARSEMLPAGTHLGCGLTVLPGDISQAVLEELLDYGYFSGIGQWRNGGWGQFRYELNKEA